MKIDLSKVAKEQIGWEIKANSMSGPNRLEPVTLERFVAPYLAQKGPTGDIPASVGELYASLVSDRENQKRDPALRTKDQQVFVDDVAKRALYRECITNTLDTLSRTYGPNF